MQYHMYQNGKVTSSDATIPVRRDISVDDVFNSANIVGYIHFKTPSQTPISLCVNFP